MAMMAQKIQSAKTAAIEEAKKTFADYNNFIFDTTSHADATICNGLTVIYNVWDSFNILPTIANVIGKVTIAYSV